MNQLVKPFEKSNNIVMRRNFNHQTKPVHGFTMIEILVTISIMSVGMLGIAAMQMNALRGGQGAIDRGEAALLISNMSERMRANTDAVLAGDYKLTKTNTAPTRVTSPADDSEIASNDQNDWITEIVASNFGGTGAAGANAPKGGITCPDPAPYQSCTLLIEWNDQSAKTNLQLEEDDSSARVYVYSSQVIF